MSLAPNISSTLLSFYYIRSGGLLFFLPQKGFGCDNVLNYQVVLANGSTLNANASSNSDLFRALKGGSNNFGVDTRSDIQVFSQGNFWGGAIEYRQTTDAEQLQALTTFKDLARFDPYAEVELSFLYLSEATPSSPPRTCSIRRLFTDIQPQLINTMRISNASAFLRKSRWLPTFKTSVRYGQSLQNYVAEQHMLY